MSERHHDDHGNGLFLRNQVVEDEVRAAHGSPTGGGVVRAVKQIQHRIAAAGLLRITRRCVDPYRTCFAVEGFRFLPVDFDGPMRHIAGFRQRRRIGRHFHQTGRRAGTKLHPRIHRVGDIDAVHGKRIDIDAGSKGAQRDAPDTVGALGHLLLCANGHPVAEEGDFRSFGGAEPERDAMVRLHLRRHERVRGRKDLSGRCRRQ